MVGEIGLTTEKKRQLIIEQCEKHDITAYELGKHKITSIPTANKILNGDASAIKNKTLNSILDYIKNKKQGSSVGSAVRAVVRVDDFIQYLERKDLVIVSRSSTEENRQLADLRVAQKKALRRSSISFYKAIELKLIPGITTTQGLQIRVDKGFFKPGEVYRDNDVKKTRRIIISAIKRLNPELL